MTDTATPTGTVDTAPRPYRLMAGAFAALRIFMGLVFLSNGLAKVTDVGNYDWGFISFNLITSPTAQAIAGGAAAQTYITPLGAFFQGVVLPSWGFWGPFLTLVEVLIGLGLLFGVATRLAAVGGLLLLAPIWLMLLRSGGYLWEYPSEDIMPLVLLAIVPAGRTAGLDRFLAPRVRYRWPF
ncbi:DoxX family membrane protein [Actinomycetospora lutea]|uniref:DoxX family membrane protein n=1 Tax=Actinomycetospora lutea TaxID=663604 RepID=UPI00236688A7|nr:DoxX family membrane protein [Actinomycetospora lutea]MDD7941034.1 DoxX family membrane protein [Actinomycetospora lutea]